MNSNNIFKIKAVLIILPFSIALFMILAGCSKSADNLYTELKAQLLNEKTFESGVESSLLFEKKFPDDSRTPEVMLALGIAFQNSKQYYDAEKTFNRLIDKYNDSKEAYNALFLLGYMYYEDIKDQEKAKKIFNTFIEMYPDSELTVSAQVIVENMGLPVEKWSIIRNIGLSSEK